MKKRRSKIEDYAFLSDTQTGALVSREGCVDWLCFPRFDSPACFASLLGDKKNGHWLFSPEEKIDKVSRRYRGDTLILETEIETASGAVRLIDFMPPRGKNPDIVRIIEGLRGEVRMQMELIIRFEYGSVIPWVRKAHDGLEAIAGPDGLILRTPIETQGKDLTTVAEFTVKKGRARSVCSDLVCIARRTGARDQSGARFARHGKILERVGETLPARRSVDGSGGAFAYYAERADLRADWRDCCRANHFAAGRNRRRA